MRAIGHFRLYSYIHIHRILGLDGFPFPLLCSPCAAFFSLSRLVRLAGNISDFILLGGYIVIEVPIVPNR